MGKLKRAVYGVLLVGGLAAVVTGQGKGCAEDSVELAGELIGVPSRHDEAEIHESETIDHEREGTRQVVRMAALGSIPNVSKKDPFEQADAEYVVKEGLGALEQTKEDLENAILDKNLGKVMNLNYRLNGAYDMAPSIELREALEEAYMSQIDMLTRIAEVSPLRQKKQFIRALQDDVQLAAQLKGLIEMQLQVAGKLGRGHQEHKWQVIFYSVYAE